MSSFSGISVALSALQAQRRAMDVTGNNVANANTDGYTRQRAALAPLGPPGVPSMHSVARLTGSGVSVSAIERLNDAFLDARVRAEVSSGGFLTTRKDVLVGIEQLLREPSDTGLSAQLDQFWSAWEDLANDPGGDAARSALLQQGGVVASTLNQSAEALNARWMNTREQARALVAEVNATAAAVADLNDTIRGSVAVGQPANELMDQRDLLVQRLSELTGASVRQREDGGVDVLLAGSALVRGSTSASIEATGSTTLGDVTGQPVGFTWAGSDPARPVSGVHGTLGALVKGLNEDLPDAMAGFDKVAAALVASVNSVHVTGVDGGGQPGGAFFDPAGVTAASIVVALTDPSQVAAAAAGQGDLDGSLADRIATQARSAPESAWRDMVVSVGVQVQSATRRAAAQADVVAQAMAAQASVAGVDLDEEMTNLVMFQRAYEGAARVMTAVDQALDVLINRTGLVGR